MTSATRELVCDFIQAIGGRYDRLPGLLHPDVIFTGAVKAGSHDRDSYVDGFRRLGPILVRIDVRQILAEGDHGAVLYDFVTDTPAGTVLTSEWLTFDHGLIRTSVLLYDMRQWPVVLEELARRSTPPAAASG
jgi:SnoaL-like domain